MDHPQAHDVLQEAEAQLEAAFVGEVLEARGIRGDGAFVFHAQQAPSAAGKEHRICIACGHGQIRAAGIVSCRGNDACGVADLLLDSGFHGAQVGAGHHDVAEDAARDVELVQDGLVPVLRACVQQAGGGSVGVLVGLGAGKQEGQVIGDHQERFGGSQLLWMLALQCQQLVDGVERLALDARAAVYRIVRHDFVGHGVHAVGALVAVSHGIAQHLVVFV